MAFFLEDANKIVPHNAEVMGAGDSMFVVQGISIGSATDWDGVDASSGASIQVQGTIISVGGNALFMSGTGNHVNVGASGALLGSLNAGAAVTAGAGHLTLTNAGEISGYYGVNCGSSDNIIHNSGHISGTKTAIHIGVQGHNEILNSGLIESSEFNVIDVDESSSGYTLLKNSGTIMASNGYFAIRALTGFVRIVNTGHITGDITLGADGGEYDGVVGTLAGTIFGGPGNDVIKTGSGRNAMDGGLGADTLESGSGRDNYVYTDPDESTGVHHDLLLDFDFRRDVFSSSIANDVVDVGPAIASDKLRGDHFNADLTKAANAAHLAVHHAVLFTPDVGSEKGEVFLIVDSNGVAGYQAGADFVIEMHNPDNIEAFGLNVFNFAG